MYTEKPKNLCDSSYCEFVLLWWSGTKPAISLRYAFTLVEISKYFPYPFPDNNNNNNNIINNKMTIQQ